MRIYESHLESQRVLQAKLDPDGKLKDRTAASQEKFKGLRAKASSLVSKGGAASFVCGTYDAARALTAGAKSSKLLR